MHLISKIAIITITLVGLFLLPTLQSIFSSNELKTIILQQCLPDNGVRPPVNDSLTPTETSSDMVYVDKFAPVLFYPLPIGNLKEIVSKLMLVLWGTKADQ